MTDIKNKLRKVLELANRPGSEAEGQTAQAQLDRLLAKYDLTVDDLVEQEVRRYRFNLQNKYENQLFVQVVCQVCRVSTFSTWKISSNKKTREIEVTPAQYAEISEIFNFYKKEMTAEIDRLMTAFFCKHDIFNPDTDATGSTTDPEELERLIEMLRALRSKKFFKPAGFIE